MKAFIDEMNLPPRKVMLLGPTSSSEAVVIGDVSKYMGIVQVITWRFLSDYTALQSQKAVSVYL